MRLKGLLAGDIRFQLKYGFYFLYAVFSALYISLLFVFPSAWREKAAILMIFTDPAAMGLFFMGAIVLLEKSERVIDSVAVSPVKPIEYLLSKLGSIALISTVVGLLIGVCSGGIVHPFYFITGILLCSCLFSSVGLLVGCKITTLNQFILATIPAEILINLPAVAYLFGFGRSWLLWHPGVCMIELCSNGSNAFFALLLLCIWTVAFVMLANIAVKEMLRAAGGVKL